MEILTETETGKEFFKNILTIISAINISFILVGLCVIVLFASEDIKENRNYILISLLILVNVVITLTLMLYSTS